MSESYSFGDGLGWLKSGRTQNKIQTHTTGMLKVTEVLLSYGMFIGVDLTWCGIPTSCITKLSM